MSHIKAKINQSIIKVKVPITSQGSVGPQGPQGEQGEQGPPGQGVAAGGLTGQVLTKASNTDYDTEWTPPATGNMQAATYDPQEIGDDAFDRENHTGTQTASTISDFDTKVSSNTDVAANTSARHSHSNKTVLDNTTASFTTSDESKLDGIETSADVTDAGNVGSAIHGATGKTTPVDADTLPLIDSAASNVLKKLSWSNIKATLKSYFDSLYSFGGAMSVTVAAADAPDDVKARADYVCDGTDDDVEIQAAIDEVGGGLVQLSQGTFSIGASIELDDNTTLQGAGKNSTILTLANDTDEDVLRSPSDADSHVFFVTIRGLAIYGNSANNSQGRGIYMRFAHTWLIEDVFIKETAEHGVDVVGDNSNIALNNVFRNCRIQDTASGQYNLVMGAFAPNNHILNCIFGSSTGEAAVGLLNDEITIVGCHVSGGGTNGIKISGSNNIVMGNFVEASATDGIYISDNVGGNRIEGNVVFNSGFGGASGTYAGIRVAGDDNVLVGNQCFDRQETKTQDYGIVIESTAQRTMVGSNTLRENGTDEISDASNSTIYSATLAGTETFTNKTIDADNNTITNIGSSELDSATQESLALADSAVQDLSDLSITATASEINVLDGITASTTELNYTDGVTSAIQTQLNGKQAQDALLDDIAALTDPGADRLLFWDDSEGDIGWLTVGTGLSITDTTISATGGGEGGGLDEVVEDTSPQLGGDLDTNGNDILFDDNTGIRDDSDNEMLIFQKTASAVNHIEITNRDTGNAPMIAAVGGDDNISLNLAAKGNGNVTVEGSVIATINDNQTITNKTINASNNTITNIGSSEVTADLITGLDADGSPVGSTDYVMTYDADATALKKVLLEDLPGGSGGISGPVSSTDHGIARWDSTGGDTLLDSGVTIDDSDNISTDGHVRANGSFAEDTTTAGVYAGVVSGTPRVMFANGTAAQNWQIDNDTGSFRWFLPGSTQFQLYQSTTAGFFDKALTINEGGYDLDTRIEGDTDANLVFVDAGNDRVGIGTATPSQKLDVAGNARVGTLLLINAATGNPEFDFQESGTTRAKTYYDVTNNRLTFQNNENNNQDAIYFTDHVTTTGNMTLGGSLSASGPVSSVHSAEPASDHTADGPTMSLLNAGESITIMNLVYLSTSDGEWHNTDADAESTSAGMLGIALGTGTDGNALTVALKGAVVRDDSWNWTPGQTLYVDTTAGAITSTAPSATDDVVRVVGYALTDDCIMFSPEESYIVHI